MNEIGMFGGQSCFFAEINNFKSQNLSFCWRGALGGIERDCVVHKRDNAKIELVQYIQSLSLSEEMISLIIISFYSAQCLTLTK